MDAKVAEQLLSEVFSRLLRLPTGSPLCVGFGLGLCYHGTAVFFLHRNHIGNKGRTRSHIAPATFTAASLRSLTRFPQSHHGLLVDRDSGGVVGRLGGVRGGGADGGRGGGGGVQSPYFGFTFLHGESASKSES